MVFNSLYDILRRFEKKTRNEEEKKDIGKVKIDSTLYFTLEQNANNETNI